MNGVVKCLALNLQRETQTQKLYDDAKLVNNWKLLKDFFFVVLKLVQNLRGRKKNFSSCIFNAVLKTFDTQKLFACLSLKKLQRENFYAHKTAFILA